MTKDILWQLQTLPTVDTTTSSSDRSKLPLATQLSLISNTPSSLGGWRELLSQGRLPWLWDLDPDAIARKETLKPPNQEWDWELLVRQLAQVNILEPRAILKHLPMGLRNRRRIWRIIEDILSEEVDKYFHTQWQKLS